MLYPFAALMLLFASASTAAAPVLKVALFDVAPYVITEAAAAPSGPYVNLARELSRRAGFEASFLILPFARIGPSLAEGKADLTIGFGTESVEKAALRLGDVMAVESLVVTSLALRPHGVAELAGYRIGRARGACQDLADAPPTRLEMVDISSFDQAIRMLALGRLDGLCLTREVLQHYMQMTGVTRDQLGAEVAISRRMVGVFVRRDLDPATVARLRAALPKLDRKASR